MTAALHVGKSKLFSATITRPILMSRQCRPPGTLRFGSFPRLLHALPPKLGSANLEIDLSELRWIEPLSMAILVAYVKDHVKRNPATNNVILVPKKYEYLQRMDFFRSVGAELPERFKRGDPTGRFVPVREIKLALPQNLWVESRHFEAPARLPIAQISSSAPANGPRFRLRREQTARRASGTSAVEGMAASSMIAVATPA